VTDNIVAMIRKPASGYSEIGTRPEPASQHSESADPPGRAKIFLKRSIIDLINGGQRNSVEVKSSIGMMMLDDVDSTLNWTNDGYFSD
jgi:hypothetical protein